MKKMSVLYQGKENAWRKLVYSAHFPFLQICFFSLFSLSTVLCSLFVARSSFAQLPEFITYQGHVVDSGGEPLNGPFDVTFRIYESETASVGEEIWLETQAGVSFAEGDFHCEIGSVNAQSATPLRNLAFDRPYWLGIEIASLGELSPKQALESVPYAYRAHDGMTLSENQTVTGSKVFTGTTQFDGSVVFNGLVSGTGICPIGTIMAWHKSFPNTPALPAEWLECNGQVVSDSESVYNGQTLPNLNGSNYFLRGNSTSGGTGGAAAHDHGGTTGNPSTDTPGAAGGYSHTPHPHTHAISSASSLPPYYNVVWIMRVK